MNKYTVYIYIYIYIYGQEKIEDTKWVNWSRSKTNNGMAKRKRTNILVDRTLHKNTDWEIKNVKTCNALTIPIKTGLN